MTKYSIYVGLIKVDIFRQVDKWRFTAHDGSELRCLGGGFETKEEAEIRAKAMVSQLTTVEP